MKEYTIKIYSYDELSDKDKHHAWETLDVNPYDYNDEYAATLEAFERVFDVGVYKYNVDPFYFPSFQYVVAGSADNCPEGDPLRVARFVWNNYSDSILKGRYYCTSGYKHRYSSIIKDTESCPLTGAWCDCYILQPIVDCLHYKVKYNSYRDMIDACLKSFFCAWSADIEYSESFEAFDEYMHDHADDYAFTESGSVFDEMRNEVIA